MGSKKHPQTPKKKDTQSVIKIKQKKGIGEKMSKPNHRLTGRHIKA
jgi:hypothetical protein